MEQHTRPAAAQLKIISGGQTGIDRIALEVARELGITTGGTAPKGYMTEEGPNLTLIEFGLVESPIYGYQARTRQNVLDGDGTVLFGDHRSTGSAATIRLCNAFKKPLIVNPGPISLQLFIKSNYISVLNVAGNRASKLNEGRSYFYREVLRIGLTPFSQISNCQ